MERTSKEGGGEATSRDVDKSMITGTRNHSEDQPKSRPA